MNNCAKKRLTYLLQRMLIMLEGMVNTPLQTLQGVSLWEYALQKGASLSDLPISFQD